jgi:hypothetical protein
VTFVKYFTDPEFHGWVDYVEPSVLLGLDDLREALGCPLFLSDDPGGICRRAGPNSQSDHNIDVHSKTRAVDGYIPDDFTYRQFYDKALECGFNAIGLYTGWPSGRRGFHVGIRPGLEKGKVARWAGIWSTQSNSHEYKGIHVLLDEVKS